MDVPDLKPRETKLPLRDLSEASPAELEKVFGKLDTFRHSLICKIHMGVRALGEKGRMWRHYFVGSFDAFGGDFRFYIRDVVKVPWRKKNLARMPAVAEQDGAADPIPELKFKRIVAAIGAEDLRAMLGDELHAQLLEDHRNTMLGVAAQCFEADRLMKLEFRRQRRRPLVSMEVKAVDTA